ncbi:MAG: tetratricopeptide repeat protein [Acidobacteriota bacterium]
MRSIRFVAVVLVLLLVAPALSAQQWAGQGRLKGKITDANTGDPVVGAKVTLRHQNSPDIGPEEELTDKRGRWSYLGLAGGNWRIVIEAEGYIPSEGSARVVEKAFGPGQSINVQLRPITEEMMKEAAGNQVMEWINAGNSLLNEGQFAAARAEYERALAELEVEDHPQLLAGIARTYYQEGNNAEAIGTLEKSLAINPDDVNALQLITSIMVDEGREEEAQAYMARLPEGAKMDTNTLLNMGIQAYNEGDAAKAVGLFDRAVAENPELIEAFYYRGLSHLNAGSNAEALADFQKVQEMDSAYKTDEVAPFVEYLKTQVEGQ